jgi:hypothetical protein
MRPLQLGDLLLFDPTLDCKNTVRANQIERTVSVSSTREI